MLLAPEQDPVSTENMDGASPMEQVSGNNTIDGAYVPDQDREIMNGEQQGAIDNGNKIMPQLDPEERTGRILGVYEPYAPEKIARADGDGKVVLFFRASWCPTCRGLDSDIKANLGAIPDGVTILDVDYDNSTSLKQKYGVTYQHTLVQVDMDGKQIAKWSSSPTLSELLKHIN